MEVSNSRIQLTGVAIYGWYLLNMILHIEYFSMLWGKDSWIRYDVRQSGLIENWVYHLTYAPDHANAIIAIHIVCSALGMFLFRYVGFFRLLSWLTGWLLYYSAYYVFDSGYLLIQAFSFLLIFQRTGNTRLSIGINQMLTHALQVMLVMGYIASSAFKLSGHQWWEGTAFYYALHLEYLTGSSLVNVWWANAPWVSKCLTWGSLLYQLLFPLMIYWQRYSRHWLILGIVFHLLTIVLFGLWGFAFAMLAGYCIFLPEKWAYRITLKAIHE